jgi:hypothetical protein
MVLLKTRAWLFDRNTSMAGKAILNSGKRRAEPFQIVFEMSYEGAENKVWK